MFKNQQKYNTKKIFLISIFSLFYCLFIFNFVEAKYTVTDAPNFLQKANVNAGVEETDLPTIVARVIQVALGTIGMIFFVLIVYAGFLWLTARGKEESITKAKGIIISAVIGIVLVVGSYALTNFVLVRVVGKTKSESAGSAPTSATTDTGTGSKGCCLEKVQTPGGYWDWGNQASARWEATVTTMAQCYILGNTCSETDSLCGSNYFQYIPDISSQAQCEEQIP